MMLQGPRIGWHQWLYTHIQDIVSKLIYGPFCIIALELAHYRPPLSHLPPSRCSIMKITQRFRFSDYHDEKHKKNCRNKKFSKALKVMYETLMQKILQQLSCQIWGWCCWITMKGQTSARIVENSSLGSVWDILHTFSIVVIIFATGVRMTQITQFRKACFGYSHATSHAC